MDRYTFDDEYVRRLLAGDRQTTDHFYAYFNVAMLMKLRSRLRTLDDIDEVRQETLVRVWKNLPNVRDGGALGSFVMSTCDHVVLEYIRRNKRAERTDAAMPTQTDPDELLQQLMRGEDNVRVRRVLERMEPRDRDILRAYFIDELPKDEICRKFGIDRQYLRVLLHRAKKKFKELYERKSTPPFPPTTSIFVTLGHLWSLWG
jgi:RNA polymerase sigma-70 factor (ECF subfamily)